MSGPGERVVIEMLQTNMIRVAAPNLSVRELRSRYEQFEIGDVSVKFCDLVFEIKTEGRQSENLFVQTHEKNHDPNLVQTEFGEVVRRVTKLPGFDEAA